MSGIRYDIETIMEVIEQVYDEWHDLCIYPDLVSFIELEGNSVISFNTLADLYRWTAEQQAKLDEQRKEQNNQRAKDHRDSDPLKHIW